MVDNVCPADRNELPGLTRSSSAGALLLPVVKFLVLHCSTGNGINLTHQVAPSVSAFNLRVSVEQFTGFRRTMRGPKTMPPCLSYRQPQAKALERQEEDFER